MRRSVTKSVFPITACLCGAYVVSWIVNSKNGFSTVSNLCYIAASLRREHAVSVHRRSAGTLLGTFNSSPIVFLLLGSTSFAYHEDPVLNSDLHFADIFFGQFLVLHLAHTMFSLVLLLNLPQRAVPVARTVLAALFATATFFLVFLHSTVCDYQLSFYATCSFVAVMSTCMLRVHVMQLIALTALEVFVLIAATIAAVVCQSELLGKEFELGSEEFDLFHGQWHYLLSVVVCVCYGIAADAVEGEVGDDEQSLEEEPSKVLDVGSLLFVVVYALFAAVLKESEVDIFWCEVALSSSSLAYCALCAIALQSTGTLNVLTEISEEKLPVVVPMVALDPAKVGP